MNGPAHGHVHANGLVAKSKNKEKETTEKELWESLSGETSFLDILYNRNFGSFDTNCLVPLASFDHTAQTSCLFFGVF